MTASAGTYALLTDGATVEIRPAVAGDADAVREMHAGLSPENMYLRFFTVSAFSAEREAVRICRAPDGRHAALLAWLDGDLVGVASYELQGQAEGFAEIAFAVPDRMHGRGVATLLLEHLVSLARSHGLRGFTAETLSENTAMLRVFADAGLPARKHLSYGTVELTFPLPMGDADPSLDGYLDRVADRESRADVASLRPLLQPGSVAVIGAGRHRGSVGRELLHNIVDGGYTGRIYPVNPRAHSMEGLPCAASVADLPEVPDLAVIAVPAAAVTKVAAECGRRGIRSLVVVTAGLGEAGPDLLAICRRYGMRLVGPNCFGLAVPGLALDATFGARHPLPGQAGLVVQSGGIGIALLEQLSRLGIGCSSFVSAGDKYDVSSNDLLTWWEQDGQTRLALLYVESFGNPRKFARTARRVGRKMPVLTVVGGRSVAGQRAAASHTAAAATPVVTQEALFEQAGIVVARSLGELTGAAALLAAQPLPAGDRVAIVSNAGGAGVLAADACGDYGLRVAALSTATRRALTRLLPAGAEVAGPVDTTAGATAAQFRDCLREVAGDPGVDAVLAVAVPTAVADLRPAVAAAALPLPLAAAFPDQAEGVRLLAGGSPGQGEPAAAGTPGPAGTPARAGAPGPAPVPAYSFPEDAVRALAHAVRYRAWRDAQHGHVPELPGIQRDDARALITAFLAGRPGGGWLPAAAATELLGCYQIPLAESRLVHDEETAAAAAAELGGRVVLKAQADGLVHKTDAGAVRLGLHGTAETRAAYRELAASFGSRLTGVIVQPMLDDGVEVLIGTVSEPVFGPLVVFGLGGVATEVLGDHAARLTPLTDADASALIHSVRAAPLLLGHRGRPAVDTEALAGILLRVSQLADDLPEVAELDLNPVIAQPGGACAVDARIRVTPAQPKDPFLRRLR
jgi:acyl-CoA synthetase (NDP forming)/GNAT superfamily N-acetyltransferase